ncbi:MAG: thiamine pyrophosphate-binding protein [Solirubrobacterales bacterium]|nr:thiamine pyrophosphate-binding protein [Solirubrobacterales bacterium]
MVATGAERIVEVLEDVGAETVFGLPGVHNLALWEALAGSPIRVVGVRHEQTAVYAADGLARTTGKLGVALVTTGPGAANTLAATGEAMASGSPVAVVATDIPSHLRRPGVRRGVLHECADQAALFAPLVKSGVTARSADDLPGDVARAFGEALRPPGGPVYIGVPTDFLAAPAPAPAPGAGETGRLPVPSEHELDGAGELLVEAARPLILAGGGAARSGAGAAIARLAEALPAPVLTTYAGKGLLSLDHPCHVPWSAHAPPVGALWDEADVVLAIGTDLDGMTTQNWALPEPPALVTINVDADDAAKNCRPTHSLVGDAGHVTSLLAERVPRVSDPAPVRSRIAAIEPELAGQFAAEDPEAAALLEAMAPVSAGGIPIVADMCIPGYWLAGFLPVGRPRSFAYPVGWGSLGFAFPASVGAALGTGGRVVCVCGDGGFLFACGELATVAQERLPVTAIVVDDGGYGMLRFDQLQAGGAPFGVDLLSPDFVALANSFGVEAEAVDGFGAEFRERLDTCLRSDGPNLLVVSARLRPPLNTSPRWYRTPAAPPPRPN